MALWGNKDTVYSTGTVAAITDAGVVTGAGTTFVDSGLVAVGQVITMGSYGSGVIKSIDSNTELTLAGVSGLSGVSTSGISQAYNISEQPKYLVEDSNYEAGEVFGVDETEIAVARAATDDARKYKPAHAGWVGVTTYTDNHGNLRVKQEVFVAGSTISADADDDDTYADS